MTTAITLDDVKGVAIQDAYIQGLVDGDPRFDQMLAIADKVIHSTYFGELRETAITYLTAHLLNASKQDSGGRGPLSSISIGGISRTYTLPYLNQKTILGMTQYGLMYMELRDTCIPKFFVGTPDFG
jgi:hypothetical protein